MPEIKHLDLFSGIHRRLRPGLRLGRDRDDRVCGDRQVLPEGIEKALAGCTDSGGY